MEAHSCNDPDPKSQMEQLQSSLNIVRTELAGVESLMKVLGERVYSIQQAIDKSNTAELRIEPQASPLYHWRMNLTGPVHLLSEDVLILIIQEVVDAVVTEMPKDTDYQIVTAFERAAPWTCASVCKRWRAACLSCPSLWTRLVQWKIPETLPKLAAFQSFRITTQLRRSGTSPLAGFLNGTTLKFGEDPPEHELSALRGIFAAFPRFSTLDLRGEMPIDILCDGNSLRCPLLENLRIEGKWWLENTGGAFKEARTLKSLSLRRSVRMDLRSTDSIPPYKDLLFWSSITILDFSHAGSSMSLSGLMGTLRNTPRLSSLILEAFNYNDLPHFNRQEQQIPTAVVSLLYLRHLYIIGAQPDIFWDRLRAPDLRTLDTGDSFPSCSNALIRFLRVSGSGSRINSLTITMYYGRPRGPGYTPEILLKANPEDITTLLSLVQSLRYLYIHGLSGRASPQGPAIITLLQCLTRHSSLVADNHEGSIVGSAGVNATNACPDLKEMHCLTGWWQLEDVPWRELRDMVQSRIIPVDEKCKQKSGLQVLSMMGFPRDMHSGVLQQLSEEDRGDMRWLNDANRLGIVKLRVKTHS